MHLDCQRVVVCHDVERPTRGRGRGVAVPEGVGLREENIVALYVCVVVPPLATNAKYPTRLVIHL